MADETTTGAAADITVDTAAEAKKKQMIKIAVTVIIIAVIGFVVWKFILKK